MSSPSPKMSPKPTAMVVSVVGGSRERPMDGRVEVTGPSTQNQGRVRERSAVEKGPRVREGTEGAEDPPRICRTCRVDVSKTHCLPCIEFLRSRMKQVHIKREQKHKLVSEATKAIKNRLAHTLSEHWASDSMIQKMLLNRRVVGLASQLKAANLTKDELSIKRTKVEQHLKEMKDTLQTKKSILSLIQKKIEQKKKERNILGQLVQSLSGLLEKASVHLHQSKRSLIADVFSLIPLNMISENQVAFGVHQLPIHETVGLPGTGDSKHIYASLGLLVHITNIFSSYLNVALPHTMVFKGSNSYINLYGTEEVYPLYDQGVEQGRYTKAISLLIENINHLCRSQGVYIDPTHQEHVVYHLLAFKSCPYVGMDDPNHLDQHRFVINSPIRMRGGVVSTDGHDDWEMI